jgi:orotidine-5'-phosphate decarboxylase
MTLTRTAGTAGGSLCVALDWPDPDRCLAVARRVSPHAAVLKVGLTAFCAGGAALVAEIGALRPVFLDLKLLDIPAQVGGAVSAARALGVRYVTAHASGGAPMLEAAVESAGDAIDILGVTVLTSLDDAALASVGVSGGAAAQVDRLAELALGAGAGGLVCSALEVGALRERFGPRSEGGPLLVVPGARASGAAGHDQLRVGPPERARAEGADLVVVGRPITTASDPAAAAERMAAALASVVPDRESA